MVMFILYYLYSNIKDQLEEVGKLVNRMEELLPELHKEEKRFDMSKLLDAISFGNMGNGMER